MTCSALQVALNACLFWASATETSRGQREKVPERTAYLQSKNLELCPAAWPGEALPLWFPWRNAWTCHGGEVGQTTMGTGNRSLHQVLPCSDSLVTNSGEMVVANLKGSARDATAGAAPSLGSFSTFSSATSSAPASNLVGIVARHVAWLATAEAVAGGSPPCY
jgi:hypothetical protein